MSDESAIPTEQAANQGSAGRDPVAGFCQQCGRTLSSATRRQVGSGVFCEPCVAAGVAPSADWKPVNAGSSAYGAAHATSTYPGARPDPTRRTRSGIAAESNPVLAGFLGFIPGVGAMYNGQYPKGAIHLIVFVVLVSLADSLNWVFWWFVWGWVFYQAFDAYHTALARREGQPLPDPFGWNELGDRMGFGRNWPPATNGAAPGSASTSFRPAPPPYAPPVDSPAGFSEAVPHVAPFAPDPKSYAPNTYGPEADVTPSGSTASYASVNVPSQAPYSPTYTGVSSPEILALSRDAHRFPAGAAWLIGLGVLFLVGNLLPSWQLEGRWLVPILLGALAIWIASQRMLALRAVRPGADGEKTWPSVNRVAGALLGPALLATVAILLALQAGYVLELRHSWPALLIVWGTLQLLERAPVASQSHPGPVSSETGQPTTGPQ